MLKDGDPIVLTTDLPKGNQQIKIHPSSISHFPPVLKKGSLGEVVSLKPSEIFVKVMIAPPTGREQEYLKDNTVHFTLPRSAQWMIAKR